VRTWAGQLAQVTRLLPFPHFRICVLILLLNCVPGAAQTLYLEESATGQAHIEAGVGDIVEVEVRADLGRFFASGISLHIVLPRGPFAVISQGKSPLTDVRPFAPGALFEGAMEVGNSLAHNNGATGLLSGQQMLAYAAIMGPGTHRGQTGSGVVARFALRCVRPVSRARIDIQSNPIHETRLVLADGFSERRFSGVRGLEITVNEPTLVEENTWGAIKAEFAD